MSLISISDLTFGYDGSTENVFENVSLNLDTSWRLGLTGRNGRGKTTLLRLLAGELEYRGKISAGVGFEYFPYNADEDALVMDIIREKAPSAQDWEISREISLLEAEEDILWRQFGTLSGGEQTKALLAALFLREISFLLIDEPTHHLDLHAREVLGRYLGRKSGFILVSHDRAFLDQAVDHILVINRQNIELQSGNFSSWYRNKLDRDNFERTENEKLKREIKQLEAAADKAARHSEKIAATKIGFDPVKTEKSLTRRPSVAKKAQKLMNRAKSMEARVERDIEAKSALLKNIDAADELKLSPLRYHSEVLARGERISLSLGDRTLFGGLSFEIKRGERVALCGQNGCGKTTLIRMLTGQLSPDSGTVTLSSGVILSVVSQTDAEVHGTLVDYAEEHGLDVSLFLAILRKLDLPRELFSRTTDGYSAGQRKKVMLARSLSERAHLYIWDEPLNYIDVISRMQIERLLTSSDITMIFTEHDKDFTEKAATRRIELK